MDSPCYHCTNRRIGCHSICESYQKFHKQNQERLKEKNKYADLKEVEYQRDRRISAHTGRRNK